MADHPVWHLQIANQMALVAEGLYPCADWVTQRSFARMHGTLKYMAKWTGEFRAVKKGEWFLSGSIIEAYHAPNDISTEYHIAKLVQVRHIDYWEEVK